jgi:hypothetical protein
MFACMKQTARLSAQASHHGVFSALLLRVDLLSEVSRHLILYALQAASGGLQPESEVDLQ